MKWRIIGLSTALGLALSLPMAAQGQTSTPPSGFLLKGRGVWVHEASGVEFPNRAGGFTRLREHTLDEAGKTVIISYRRKIHGEPVVVRIALFQIIGLTPEQHFLALQSMVGSYFDNLKFSDVKLGGQGPFDPPRLPPGSGYQGRYSATLNGTPYELSLSTVRFGPWDARLTAAYPQADAGAAQRQILELVEDIRLPKPPRRGARH